MNLQNVSANPKKEVTLSFGIDLINEAIKKIVVNHKESYKFDRHDIVMNSVRLNCMWGIYWNGFIEFSFQKIDDNTTKVIIEAGDKKGSINSKVEADNAQIYLTEATALLSDYLSNNVDEKGKAKFKRTLPSGCLVFIPIILGTISMMVYLFTLKN